MPINLSHSHGEQKWSLPGKFAHLYEFSLPGKFALLTEWFAAHFILCHYILFAQM